VGQILPKTRVVRWRKGRFVKVNIPISCAVSLVTSIAVIKCSKDFNDLPILSIFCLVTLGQNSCRGVMFKVCWSLPILFPGEALKFIK